MFWMARTSPEKSSPVFPHGLATATAGSTPNPLPEIVTVGFSGPPVNFTDEMTEVANAEEASIASTDSVATPASDRPNRARVKRVDCAVRNIRPTPDSGTVKTAKTG